MKNTKLQIINETNDSCREESFCSCCNTGAPEEISPLTKRRHYIIGAVALTLLLSGLAIEFFTPLKLVAQIIFLSVIAVAGREILKNAWQSILKRRLDMNCLISIAAFGSFFIGHGEEGAAVVFLFFVAETLEAYAADNARKSLRQLLSLAPETANVKRDGREVELHVQEIGTGEIIAVRPGEKIPLDGKIVAGDSSVNESPITGESIPVEKGYGDLVYAGTLNEEGYLEVETTKKAGDTVLSRIVKLVEEAETKKSGTEKFIDRFARYYTPAVIGLALAAFLIPTFIFGQPWDVWFYRALVLLVISCPCALAISTPVAMVSAITGAARHGVLIKGATFIEELNRIKAFAFDKTGTLTRGRLDVTDIIDLDGDSPEKVLSIAASLESRSEHPVAKAIIKKARKESLEIKEVESFTSLKGRGIKAEIKGMTYYAGAKNLFEDLPIELPEEVSQFEREGKTTILITDENRPIGIIALGDVMRQEAPEVIADLRKLHIRTELITGDNRRVAAKLAKDVGIDEYHAELLPEDKVKVAEDLVKRYGSVAMVGDGVNDAPALAAANVGIAMGTIGADVAIETADIALMHDDLSKVDYLIHLSRKTMNVVKQNVMASILIKGTLTILALMGLINLWVAVAVGDMGLSLSVILNAIRLNRVKA